MSASWKEQIMARSYTFFIHMNATKQWLSLTRKERGAYFAKWQKDIFASYPKVSVKFYDVEAFSARCSDIAVYETEDIQSYYFLIEELRDSEVYTVPYFEVVDIFPALENGFAEFESAMDERRL
jgi:hypothetical protein